MEIKELSNEEILKIIQTREPLGRFYTKEGDFFVGVDNTHGDAWTEAFDSLQRCKDWLNGLFEVE